MSLNGVNISTNNTPQRPYRWGKTGLKELLPRNFGLIKDTFKSLGHKNFAMYFAGQLISLIGSWIQQVAMGYLVFKITNSVFMLSLSIFLSQIPVLFVTPFAGVIVDRFNRRKILMATQFLLMAHSLVFAVLTLTGYINTFSIMVLCLLFGVFVSFDAPTRQSLYSKLVPKEDLSNAIALNSTAINGTRFIGPALGGVLIASIGEGYCFLLNTLTFWATILALYFMNLNFEKVDTQNKSTLFQIKEGFSYAAKILPIRALLMLMALISFFGAPFPMLLPAFTERLGGTSQVLGNLMSCIGLGALAAALYLASRKSVLGLGKLVTLSCILLGVSIIFVSFVKVAFIAYIFCVPLGFGLIATAASCNTLLQSLVDENKRGRIMSMFTMCFFGMQPVGSLLQGYVAKFIPLGFVTAFAGLMCIAGGIIFEYFRPIIRSHARQIFYTKGIVIPEIAQALKVATKKPSL